MSDKQLNELNQLPSTANTSRITLITPNTAIGKLRQFLTQELATAKNIKSRVNRQSVIQSLTQMQTHISQMKCLPDNGIAMFVECSI